jgi:hypothetical protein
MTACFSLSAYAQGQYDPAKLMAAQREAMAALSFMDGVWRGPAWVMLPSGEKHHLTQTERIGPMLDGTLKVIEGRGYEADGTVSFRAFGVISYDLEQEAYTIRSYARGMAGDFSFTLTEEGYTWEIPAGPMTIRYTGVVTDSTIHEVGDRIVPESEPIRFFEMSLERVGDTDWPAADPVTPE